MVVFAQNGETARCIPAGGSLHVLPNATSIDVQDVAAAGPRRKDLVFVGRLLPWKGGTLAVRSLRYLQQPDAMLRIFGDGPERGRIARAARDWGVADRVQFESRVSRDELLRIVATAGVLVHPSCHDEASLAVAEALSLGTPVVCLDRGGPAELLRHWPGAPAASVPPRSPEQTARTLAATIDRFLTNPPPVLKRAQPPVTSFASELLAAYDTAVAAGRNVPRRSTVVWGFPAGKPQVFAESPAGLSKGVLVYGFGRRLPRWIQSAMSVQVRLPVLRRLIAEQRARPEPVCGWTVWETILAAVRERNPDASGDWLLFSSQWDKQRSSLLGLNARGLPEFFLVVEPVDKLSRPLLTVSSFRVPACTHSFRIGDWAVRQYEPLPRYHRRTRWNADRIRAVARDASVALTPALKRPADVPAHWRPMHGDLVPWNLREDDRGNLWLLDWEDAGWGPPLADLVRFIVAHYSLGWSSPRRIAGCVARTLATEPNDALHEAARFWLRHRNLSPGANTEGWPRQKARDAQRRDREFAAFRVLASATRKRKTPGLGIARTGSAGAG